MIARQADDDRSSAGVTTLPSSAKRDHANSTHRTRARRKRRLLQTRQVHSEVGLSEGPETITPRSPGQVRVDTRAFDCSSAVPYVHT